MSDFNIPEDMKKNYLERRKKDLEDCLQAFKDKNVEVLSRISHQIKGNAISFGFEDLGNIALQLENATENKDWLTIEKKINEFKKFMSKY